MVLRLKNSAGEWVGVPALEGKAGEGIPSISSFDNGKVLMVVGGTAVWAEYTGNGAIASDQVASAEGVKF